MAGMESSEKPLLCRRHVAAGLAFWAIYCVIAVGLRGVRWDEQYEFAQVITREVVYPEGHPYPYCVRNALNLQIYATAALDWLTGSPAIVCGFRNMLYLLATVTPVYLLGVLLGGRALAGHAAAVLILLGAHEEFDACYQLFAWPQYASTGHVGLGYALTALALLAGGHLGAGLFMLGLMPCVHIGQMPILLGCSAVAGAYTALKDRAELKHILRSAPWGLAGLAVCAAVWLGKGAVHVPLPQSGPYVSTADAAAVWAGYIAQDALRALPGRPTSYTNSFIVLAAALLITTLLYLSSRKNRQSSIVNRQSMVWVYVVLVAAAVWGVMAVHYAVGEHVPYVLISWMPYRFANHAAYILIAAVAAVLCGYSNKAQWVMPAVLVVGAVRPFLAGLLPGSLYMRYVAGGEGLLFFLMGLACFVLLAQKTGTDSLFGSLKSVSVPAFCGSMAHKWLFAGGTAVMLLSALALGLRHQFGLACALAGFVAAAVAPRWQMRATSRVAVAALALAVVLMTAGQWRGRQHLPAARFDRDVVSYLAARGEAGAMLLARPEQYTLQARSGHPVVADTCLAPWIPYMPSIGPAIQKIHQDFYGETFSPPHKGEWNTLWSERTEADWQDLRRAYGVGYVVSPNQVPLQLPVAVPGPVETLYRIP
ncbi:MAG TPA: hypothetical protein VMZ06_11185 [Candidatus Bathyarchaeia archaeon]|nr:hypothetical protein [Candidatus Bathyarchaeia archaeon]